MSTFDLRNPELQPGDRGDGPPDRLAELNGLLRALNAEVRAQRQKVDRLAAEGYLGAARMADQRLIRLEAERDARADERRELEEPS